MGNTKHDEVTITINLSEASVRWNELRTAVAVADMSHKTRKHVRESICCSPRGSWTQPLSTPTPCICSDFTHATDPFIAATIIAPSHSDWIHAHSHRITVTSICIAQWPATLHRNSRFLCLPGVESAASALRKPFRERVDIYRPSCRAEIALRQSWILCWPLSLRAFMLLQWLLILTKQRSCLNVLFQYLFIGSTGNIF